MSPDSQRARHKNLRWLILLALNYAQPVGANKTIIVSTLGPVMLDLSHLEIHQNLTYLVKHGLITVLSPDSPQAQWVYKLTRLGVDVVEYNIGCEPGIARPDKED